MRFLAAVGEAGDEIGHHPRVTIGKGHVDLELVTGDAIYRDDEGTEHVVEWVTQQDVDLARRITEIAAEHGLDADPASVSEIELGLDTARSATIAPVWAALLTGRRRVPGPGHAQRRDPRRHGPGAEPVVRRRRRATRPRASGSTSRSTWRPRWPSSGSPPPSPRAGPSSTTATRPSLTVIADQEGNRGVICADTSAAQQD